MGSAVVGLPAPAAAAPRYAGLALGEDQASDEIAADDGEDVDADEAAADRLDAGAPEDDRRDRDRSQSIDLPATQQSPVSSGEVTRPSAIGGAGCFAVGRRGAAPLCEGRSVRSATVVSSLLSTPRRGRRARPSAIRVWTVDALHRSASCGRNARAISSRWTRAREQGRRPASRIALGDGRWIANGCR